MNMQTRTLLFLGALAGPVFCGLVLAQSSFREGFDLVRLPLSLLALGPGGWIQTMNFALTAALAFAGGLGLMAATGRKSVAWLLGVYASGLLIAAIFPAPPSKGFPPGFAEPHVLPFSAKMHGVGFFVAHIGIILCCLFMVAEYFQRKRRIAAIVSILVALATPAVILAGFGHEAIIGILFFSVGALVLGWLTIVCVDQIARLRQPQTRQAL